MGCTTDRVFPPNRAELTLPFLAYGRSNPNPGVVNGELRSATLVIQGKTLLTGSDWVIQFSDNAPPGKYTLVVKSATHGLLTLRTITLLQKPSQGTTAVPSALAGGPSISSPANGANVASHASLSASGTVTAGTLVSLAELTYTGPQGGTLPGTINQTGTNWSATFTGVPPLPTGNEPAILTVWDDQVPANDTSVSITVTP